MSTQFPHDADGTSIPVLGLRPGGAQALSVTTTSTRNAIAFSATTRVIGVYASGPVFIRTGDSSVTATTTDHYLPAETMVDLSLGGDKRGRHTNIAAVRASVDCTLYISEKE